MLRAGLNLRWLATSRCSTAPLDENSLEPSAIAAPSSISVPARRRMPK